MLCAFGFDRVGVVVGDLYFDNPRAARGQEGAEPGDAESLRAAAPEIVDVARRLLGRVRAGELGHPPQGQDTDIIRTGWL